MTKQLLVDTHAHIFSDNTDRYPFAPAGGKLAAWATERPVHGETLLQFMAEAGVDKAVLVQPASVHGYDNRYVLDVAGQHPEKFVAVCVLNSLAPDVVDQLSYWVQERGAAGIRISAPIKDGRVDWLQAPVVWARAEQLRLPMCVLLVVANQAAGVPVLKDMLERYPETVLLLDHVAHPIWEEGPPLFGLGPLLKLARFPGVHIKFTTTALNCLDAAGVEPSSPLRVLVDAFGAHRIMWGSDMPNATGTYTSMVERIRAAISGLSASDQEWILSRTALTLYPRLAGSA